MNIQQIVYATDFSSSSRNALKMAVAIARDRGAKLWIVHVTEPRPAYTVAGVYASLPSGNQFGDENAQLQEVVPEDSAVPCEHRLLIGEPAEEIVRFATEQQADLIVIGTHGRTGLTRILLGSVAEAVLRHATCPVLTLRG